MKQNKSRTAKLLATATITAGFMVAASSPANAGWTYGDSSLRRVVNDISICGAAPGTPGSITLEAVSRVVEFVAPAGFGIGSTFPNALIETIYSDAALTVPVVSVSIPEVVTGPVDASGYWPMTGRATVALPASYRPGTTVYVGQFSGFGTPKTPVALTVNDAKYGCPPIVPPTTVPKDDDDDHKDHKDKDHKDHKDKDRKDKDKGRKNKKNSDDD
jgi:hypothetical protein